MLKPRIPRTVPGKSSRPRDVPKAPKHLAFVRCLPCCVCGRVAKQGGLIIEAHHLLQVDQLPKGIGRKHADKWTVPLCFGHHGALHMQGDEESFFAGYSIRDQRGLAQALWKISPDYDAGLRVVERCRKVTA